MKILRQLKKWKRLFGPSKSLLDLPNELILQIAQYLSAEGVNNLLRASHFLKLLLSPVLSEHAFSPSSRVGIRSTTVLHWATRNNRIPMLKMLLSKGAIIDVNATETKEWTALHIATMQQNVEAFKLLLESGANTHARSMAALTPASIAVVSGNETLTKILLENGANPDEVIRGTGGMSLLHYAAVLGHMKIIDLLIEAGCNTAAVDRNGLSVAQLAAAYGKHNVVEQFLGIGVAFETAPDMQMLYQSIESMDENLYIYEVFKKLDKVKCYPCN